MKILASLVTLASLTATAASAGQYEQNQWPNWYVGVQGSVSFIEETDVNVQGNGVGDLDFDTGYGLGLSLGYKPGPTNTFFDNTRFELEYYYRNSEIDTFAAAGNNAQISDDISSDTYMINAFYDFPTNTVLTPYLGAGVGMSEIELTIPALAVQGNDNVFAYQLMGGVSWQPQSLLNTELHVGYRFLDASDPDFAAIGGARLDHDYQVHNVEAGARFRF